MTKEKITKCNHDYYKVLTKIEYHNYEVCRKCGHKRKAKNGR